MPNLNKVILMGNLTRDPEVRYTPKGTAVGDIGIAVNRRIKNGDNWEDETTFVDVTLWASSAEYAQKYLTKGSPVFIEGRLQMDTWEDKQSGQKRSKLKVVAESVQGLQKSGDARGGQHSPAPAGGRDHGYDDSEEPPF
jgi:single-strand DNA-binding protein